MSAHTDLSKLATLIEKFHNQTFDLKDHQVFINILASIQTNMEMEEQAKTRTELLDELSTTLAELTLYAQANQMPTYTSYSGESQLFRFCLINLDQHTQNGSAIFLVSKSVFAGNEISPGVYHWQHPPAYGYDEADVIQEFNAEYARKQNLSSKVIKEIITKGQGIIQTNSLTETKKHDPLQKYRNRWPDVNDFSRHNLHIDDLDQLETFDLKELSSQFNVEITIDYADNYISILGPTEGVQRVYKILQACSTLTSCTYSGLDLFLIST